MNAERFFQRLDRLQQHWLSNKATIWGGADAICIPHGSANEDILYSKSAAMNLYFFGLEDFTDSIILLTKDNFFFMSSSKKCKFLEEQLQPKIEGSGFQVHFLEKTKDEGANRELFHKLIGAVRKNNGKKLGSLFKDKTPGTFIESWMSLVDSSGIEKVEINSGIGYFLAIKDDVEQVNPQLSVVFQAVLIFSNTRPMTVDNQDLCKRAAVLSNKVMKHGFVQEMEGILDEDKKISHQALSRKVRHMHECTDANMYLVDGTLLCPAAA